MLFASYGGSYRQCPISGQETPLSTALVPLAPARHDDDGTSCTARRPNADFLAHLIATSAQVPQTRERRRAEPEEAIAAYCARCTLPAAPGRAVSRSL
jgi:hypothetical protein